MFGSAFGGPGPLLLLLLALGIDALFGDWLDRILPDPAGLARRFCNAADARLNRAERGATAQVFRGALVVLALLVIVNLRQSRQNSAVRRQRAALTPKT